MEAKTPFLSDQERRQVMEMEQYWRAYYKIQGDMAEADKTIKSLMSQILLASGFHPSAYEFFEFLVKDSRKYDFLEAYQAGKECFLYGPPEQSDFEGTPYEKGLYLLLRSLSLNPEKAAFEAEFQKCYNELIGQIPIEDSKSLPACLLVEYRDAYCGPNRHFEDFYKMGYDNAANPSFQQRDGNFVPVPPGMIKGERNNER